jgi:hypothetical protein
VGGSGDRGHPTRSRLHGDDEVEPVDVAGRQARAVRLHDRGRAGAGHLDTVDRVEGTGERAEVGRGLGPVPRHDGRADRRREECDQDGDEPDREHDDGGATMVVLTPRPGHGHGSTPGSVAATAVAPTLIPSTQPPNG